MLASKDASNSSIAPITVHLENCKLGFPGEQEVKYCNALAKTCK